MIIGKTPFRISFLGGGTDFPAWYEKAGKSGIVLSTTIDKYSYITCRKNIDFFNRHKLVYSIIEYIPTDKLDNINHPSIREVFKFMEIKESLFINYDADLPARSGIGSSSAFTVGLLNVLHAFKGNNINFDIKRILAEQAIYVEQKLIKENVGSQDQFSTAYGGFNIIEFSKERINVKPIEDKDFIEELEDSLMLFFTGYTRIADLIEKDKLDNISNNEKYYDRLYDLTNDFILNKMPIQLLHLYLEEAWNLKKSLSDKVSNSVLDEIYQIALVSGASGGKLLGSGGGGFFLFLVRGNKNKVRLREALKNLKEVPFKFENKGTHIIFKEDKK